MFPGLVDTSFWHEFISFNRRGDSTCAIIPMSRNTVPKNTIEMILVLLFEEKIVRIPNVQINLPDKHSQRNLPRAELPP